MSLGTCAVVSRGVTGWGFLWGSSICPCLPIPPFLPDLASLNLNSGSSGASDQDTLAPLPHPSVPWPLGQGYPYQYPGPPPCFPPAYQDPGFSYGSGSAGSQQSEGESHASPSSTPTPWLCLALLLSSVLLLCVWVLVGPISGVSVGQGGG